MAGGKTETDPIILARYCDSFKNGTKELFDKGPMEGDMWLFELYHHLTDCAAVLRARAQPEKR